jgi:hypothetical protein
MRRVVPALAAALLLALAVGTVQAAKSDKSFGARFCFAQAVAAPAGTGDLVATVSWSGYRVDGVGFGVGDGTGAGFGVINPVEPPARSGEVTVALGVDNSTGFAGVDIRNVNHIWASQEQNAPGGDWSGLTACS